jgi:hypothetical protein
MQRFNHLTNLMPAGRRQHDQTIMNTKIITETAQKTLDGTMSFPDAKP